MEVYDNMPGFSGIIGGFESGEYHCYRYFLHEGTPNITENLWEKKISVLSHLTKQTCFGLTRLAWRINFALSHFVFCFCVDASGEGMAR